MQIVQILRLPALQALPALPALPALQALAVMLCLGGCHLIFPFGVVGAPDGGAPLPDSAADTSVTDRSIYGDLPLDANIPVPDKGTNPGKWSQLAVNGAKWSTSITPHIWGHSTTEIYIAAGSVIFICEDKGTSLFCSKQKEVIAGNTIHDLGGFGTATYAVGETNLAYYKKEALASWTQIDVKSGSRTFQSIWCQAADSCVVGGIETSSSSGFVGTLEPGDFKFVFSVFKPIHGVWLASNGMVVAVASDGYAYHRPLSTASLDKKQPAPGTTLKAVWGDSYLDVHAVGTGGKMMHFNGTTWTSSKMTVTADLNAVWGSSKTNVFIVGTTGTIIPHNGKTWSNVISGPFGGANLTDIWGASANKVYVVAPDTRIFRGGS
jgi:hypothetical protein